MSDVCVLKGAQIFDGSDIVSEGELNVVIEDGIIKDVGGSIPTNHAALFDLAGTTLMPGMIDLHVHAYASHIDPKECDNAGFTYRAAHAFRFLHHALLCGFTSVRDVGGGDWELWRAVEDGLVEAPRLFYVGNILSMTGGHGDLRGPTDRNHTAGYCSCGTSNALGVVVDGVDACIKAAREELRRGAHCIKIMASGGVISPTDPIWMNQFRDDEIRAVVNECSERRTYVAAHCHPSSSIRRSIELGVRCIEHGTLIDVATANFAAQQGTFIVPTLAIIDALANCADELGGDSVMREKLATLSSEAIVALDRMRSAGVKIGFGTDLLGRLYTRQCTEFELRSAVFSPIEILRQATSIAAEILMQSNRLGCIRPGAVADLLVVNGDPTQDLSLLSQNGASLGLIICRGKVIKNSLPN